MRSGHTKPGWLSKVAAPARATGGRRSEAGEAAPPPAKRPGRDLMVIGPALSV